MRALILVLLTFSFPAVVFSQPAQHLKAELLSETASLTPGKSVTLGLHFTMDSGWHTYWQNPGDAGLATSFVLKLPMGFHAGKTLWPIPQRIAMPDVTDFGYENEALLMIPVTVPKNLKPGEPFKFVAKVQWLVCKETCIPGEAKLTLEVPVASGQAPSVSNPLFAKARKTLPVRLPATMKVSATLDSSTFRLTFSGPTSVTKASFFPSIPNQINNTADQTFQALGSGFTLTVKRSDQLLANVQKLDGLLVVEDHGSKTGYEVSIPLTQLK